MTHLNNLLGLISLSATSHSHGQIPVTRDIASLHWARQEKKRRNTLEEKQPAESSESLPHLIYPVLPSPPPLPLHQLHTTGDTVRDTDTRTQFMRQKCRNENSTCEKKERKLRKKKSSQLNLPHLFSISSVLFNFPPLPLHQLHTIGDTVRDTDISETVH